MLTPSPSEMVGALYGEDRQDPDDRDLLFFWGTPGAQELANFVWDPRVPEVEAPWPRWEYEPMTPKEHMKMILGVQDTGMLYAKEQLLGLLEES